jgi:hypothetical protein
VEAGFGHLTANHALSIPPKKTRRKPRARPLPWGAWDIDGQIRPIEALGDAGADEIALLRSYMPLVLRVAPQDNRSPNRL